MQTAENPLRSKRTPAVSGGAGLLSLQIVRAVAAVSVVYFHVGGHPRFGAFGVDLFFVLSGFVMAMLVAQGATPGGFALRRIVRIVPLYWLTTLAVVLIGVLRPTWLATAAPGIGDVLRSLFFVPYLRENGVLAPVLGLGWTLNYEMFFYGLIVLSLCWAPQRVLVRVAAALLLLQAGASLAGEGVMAMFLGSSHLLEFVLGMACHAVWQRGLCSRVPWGVALLLWLGAYVAMAALQATGRSFVQLFAYGVPSALMLLASLRVEPLLRALQAGRRSVGRAALVTLLALGDASYAIYLAHFFVTEAIRLVLAPSLLGRPLSGLGEELAAVVLAVAAGYLVYVAVDRPVHRACVARLTAWWPPTGRAVTLGGRPRRRS